MDGEHKSPLRIKWASLGVLLFCVGQTIGIIVDFVNRKKLSSTMPIKLSWIIGTVVQFLGAAISAAALFLAITVNLSLVNPFEITNSEAASRLEPFRVIFIAGICTILVGELLKAISCFIPQQPDRVPSHNKIPRRKIVSVIFGFISLPLLLLLALSFVYGSVFEYDLVSLKEDGKMSSRMIAVQQGILVYPLIALVLWCGYSLLSILRVSLIPGIQNQSIER